MEIQLQLDGNGRTKWVKPPSDNSEETQDASETAAQSAASSTSIDFSSKTTMTSLVPPTAEQHDDEWRTWMDNILFDCEITDCGLMPRTFWMPADGTKPRCALEQMALDVFYHHVPTDCTFDPTTSGAEWWVQIRPSPPVGRYTMHADEDNISKSGISFHWDKDEELRLLAGGSLYVHPYLSTVTYLTSLGAPTMAMNVRVNYATGEWIVPNNNNDERESSVEAFVSWPRQGKHLSFDGQFLHAAPPDLMENGAFEEQCKITDEIVESMSSDKTKKEVERCCKILERRHRRVTFLVNIWLNYKPFNVELFPETMIDKLTKVEEDKWKGMFTTTAAYDTRENSDTMRSVAVQDGVVHDEQVEKADTPRDFTWPMGDCDSGETIEMQMPLASVRQEAVAGGNVRIQWKQSSDSTPAGVRLVKVDVKQSTREETGDDANNGSTNTSSDSQSSAKRLKLDNGNGDTS